MRRLISITAFVLSLAVPLWGQHGGGHAGGGGGRASFGGGRAGGFSGGHTGVGHAAGGNRSSPGVSRGFSHVPSFPRSGSSFSSRRGFHGRGPIINNYGYNRCWGRGCRRWGYANPWWYAGYYDPWWWDDRSSYDEDREREIRLANQMNQQSLEEQRMLRQEEADGDQDLYARPAPAARSESEAASPPPSTILVFRDQHQQEVQNYAIVGQTLWNFSAGGTKKVSLADLDVAATVKVNDDRGVTFRLPTSGEAQ